MRSSEVESVPLLIAAVTAAIVSVDSVARFFIDPLLPGWSVRVALVVCAIAGAVALARGLARRHWTLALLGASVVCLVLGSMVGVEAPVADVGRLLAPVMLVTCAVLIVRRTIRWERAAWSTVGVLALGWMSGTFIPIGLVLGLSVQAASLVLVVVVIAAPLAHPLGQAVRALWNSAAVR
jgi:hypothetical protein